MPLGIGYVRIYSHRSDLPAEQTALNPEAAPDRAGIALCLSGGGYRAMLFHLGSLWRLNEMSYLPKLDQVSSVSGGSITAGTLALAWKDLASTTAARPPLSPRRSPPHCTRSRRGRSTSRRWRGGCSGSARSATGSP